MAEEDIIYGKNMHLFGGIEPSNLTRFDIETYADDKYIRLLVDFPRDTVINGSTLCTVDGVVIRRKEDGFPRNEFDGRLIADIKQSGVVIDSNSNKRLKYYYAAFPYSTQGVYNRNPQNRVSFNTHKVLIDEEKTTLEYIYDAVNKYFSVKCTVFVKRFNTSSFGKIEIRKGTNSYPLNDKQGILVHKQVINPSDKNSFEIWDSEKIKNEGTYYYSIFCYNSENEEYYEKVYQTSIDLKMYGYLFGYDLKEQEPNPNTRVSYPDTVDNRNFSPLHYDSDYKTFGMGGWGNKPGFMPKPCVLGYDGIVKYYLDPINYNKRENKKNTNSTRITDFDLDGNVMMEWSKIYTKRWSDNGVYKFRCSDTKIDDSWECWCNYDKNDNEIDHFYTAIYQGINDSSGRLRSIRQYDYIINNQNNFLDDIEKAKKNGEDWTIETVAERLLVQDLLIMLAKNSDCKAIYGNGCLKDYTDNTIDMTSGGLFVRDDTKAVKIFGMEHYWGAYHKRVLGLVIDDDNHYKLKITRGVKDGSRVKEYNLDGNGYVDVYLDGPNETNRSYISSMKAFYFGRLPSGLNGSNNQYESDWVSNPDINKVRTPYFSGYNSAFNIPGGVFAIQFSSHLSDIRDKNIGSMLVCKPSLLK